MCFISFPRCVINERVNFREIIINLNCCLKGKFICFVFCEILNLLLESMLYFMLNIVYNVKFNALDLHSYFEKFLTSMSLCKFKVSQIVIL